MTYKFKKMMGPATDWPIGSKEWAERTSALLQTHVQTVSRNTVHHLKKFIKEMFETDPRVWDVWPDPPFGTPDDYFQAVTGHSWKALCGIIAELTGDADFGVKQMQIELAEAQVEHRHAGRPTNKMPYPVRHLSQGNSREALLRRLTRHAPDHLAAYERGEYKTVKEAARAAGIVPPKLSHFEQIKRWLPRLTDEERRRLRELLG